MEEYSVEDPSAVKQDNESLLLTSKDPHLSHLFGDDPKTPNSVATADVSGQSVMEDSRQFHDEGTNEPEYRLFEEQSYVPDLSPTNQMVFDGGGTSSQNTTETAGPSLSKGGGTFPRRKLLVRSNGSAKVKPFPCKEPGCGKSFCDIRVLQKHVERVHSNDLNNNSVTAVQKLPETERANLPIESSASAEEITRATQQGYATVEQPADYNKSTSVPSNANASGRFNGPMPSSVLDVNSISGEDVEREVNEIEFAQANNTNLFNAQLLAQNTSQNALQNQHAQSDTGTQQSAADFMQRQSTRALQQIAMSVQMRSSQYNPPLQVISTMASTRMPEPSAKQQFMPMHGPITGVRAQLRKSLSSNGKLENMNSMSREWSRVQIPVGGSLDSGMSQNFFQVRMHGESDPTNIDNAPLLKNLLATPKTARRTSSSGDVGFIQENGQLPNSTGFPATLVNSWGTETQPQSNLQSPILTAKRNEFQYHRSLSDIPKLDQSPNPNPSPLHSPSYVNAPQFPMQQHNQTTPLPQQNDEQRFFPDNIMVNNNNNQQMTEESSEKNLNEMIIESESLVQDLIDQEEANSNQSQVQQQLMIYAEGGQNIDPSVPIQGRVTPPPAYNLNPNPVVMNAELNDASNQAAQIYMAQNQIKSEPQSPMIMSPIAQRSFFGNQGNAMGVHPAGNMQPLASPTTPHHQMPLQPGMQPLTPVGEAQWQFPMSGQNQNYGGVPQSPVTPVPPINISQLPVQPNQDNIVQNINYLPHSRQPGSGKPKQVRTRRPSGGSARKNPDGTLSCAICGHSFRSVPALNGHMRVHSSSADKKNKDERQRKTSGSSSSGGNESRTPQSLSSPTTPTLNKINPTASMYQNTAAYNSVTVPAYSHPTTLYNPALSSMDATGAVVPITQNMSPRDASLMHRINQQAGLYPYALPHAGPMQPHDALLAAADLFARSEPDFTPFLRSPGSGREDFPRTSADLPPVPDLQHFLGPHQGAGAGKNELAAAYRNTPPSSVILVPHPQSSAVPSYLVRQSERMQMPFVTLSLPTQGLPGMRQSFANSPPQEQNQPNSTALENIQYIQQPLLQHPSNRSTPLADFADIAVLHDQGQLFTNNQMLVAPLGVGQNQQSEDNMQQMQQQSHGQQQGEQIPLPYSSADVGILAKDLLWPQESHQQSNNMAKMEPGDSVPLKDENFLPSSISHIQKSSEGQLGQPNTTDPFIFPVTVPVHCSRDGSNTVTTTLQNFYRQNHSDVFSNNMSAFHDDPMVQESINVANPSTILPNSMMGGNPSGFRSFRQRHHSEGSILKKTWQPELSGKDDMKPLVKTDMSSFASSTSKTPPVLINYHSTETLQRTEQMPVTGSKRKLENSEAQAARHDMNIKKIKTETQPQNLTMAHLAATLSQVPDVKREEVWTVPKHTAPPNRQRHRRHSADSRLQYRSGPLFQRSAYLQSMQMAGKGVNGRSTLGSTDSRGKRRPPPLIIPASVNTMGGHPYPNGSLFISQLHHRRRPSGDSSSSCGNEKIPPYTPPPMLSPVRFGTGLYHNTPGTPLLKPLYRQASGEHVVIPTIPEEDIEEDFVRSTNPKINIGDDYQADLPSLCPRWRLERDIHKAELIWKPSQEIKTDNSTQSRHVEEYLKLACSAAVPFGGCNKEFALHLLYENKGDILASVRQLLHTKVSVPFDHWMASYTYLGSVRWSLKERQSFERAMLEYHKDFYQISKLVATKTTAECVDYYYHTMKRRRRRIQRPRRFRRDSEEEDARRSFSPLPNGFEPQQSHENDFLQDHIPMRREPKLEPVLLPQHQAEHEPRRSEVVRRSPPTTAFIRAPQVSRVVSAISQPTPPSVIGFSPVSMASAQHIPQIHSYAKQPLNIPTPPLQQQTPPSGVRNYTQQPVTCKVLNCNQIFPSMQLLLQHQQSHKTLKPYFDRLNQAIPSPASSPGSATSADADAPQFQCPRCGKSFSKVKSRNAHMKTHGKLAQEKRRQKEEEARRKMEEAAAWRNRAQQPPPPQHVIISTSPGKRGELIHFQTVPSPLTKPPGM